MKLSASAQWVIRIIGSCKTPLQMELCENLIECYSAKYKDEHIEHIQEVFHKKAVQTNYFQHKAIKTKESNG